MVFSEAAAAMISSSLGNEPIAFVRTASLSVTPGPANRGDAVGDDPPAAEQLVDGQRWPHIMRIWLDQNAEPLGRYANLREHYSHHGLTSAVLHGGLRYVWRDALAVRSGGNAYGRRGAGTWGARAVRRSSPWVWT